MARRKIRHLPPGKGNRPRRRVAVVQATAEQSTYGKDHLIAKVISLSTLTGRELEKSAEKAINAVFAALVHVFTEGDVNIPEFGHLQAFKGKGKVKVTFTPAKKLEKCAEARLYNPQPAPQPTPSPAPQPAPSPQPEPQPTPTPEPEPGPALASTPEPQPVPAPAPAPEPAQPAPAPMEDIARGKPIVAPLSAQGYPIANVVDGNPETKWVSGFNVPCWLNIQLGAVYQVKRIIARAPENLTMSYRIKGCIVGHPVQDLIVVPNATGVMMWDNLDFTISAIEVWFESSSHPSRWVEFIELEVYGVPAQ